MKSILTLFSLLLFSCSVLKNNNQNEAYYFYFEAEESKMNSYHNLKKHNKSFTYEIERAASILFFAKKDGNEFKIKPKDTFGLGVKSYGWLNRLDNTSRERFFNHDPIKKFYIIEKDSLSHNLNLVEVQFIDEIE